MVPNEHKLGNQILPSVVVVVVVVIVGGSTSLNLISARWSQLNGRTLDPPTKENSMKMFEEAPMG